MSDELDQLAVSTVRALAMDAVEEASSGHPGTPMALAPLAYVLFTRHLAHDPAEPAWPDRDRFVLSAGHASMLQYALAHLTGYDLPREELARFRQLGSHTPGHPEYGHTPGVETTTGPLGQGLSNAVGMALAERMLAETFNRDGHEIVDHHTWAIASDGDLMEGVSSEASSLAGHLGLDKLVVMWDDNNITIDGATSLAFSEDVLTRYAGYGWRTFEVSDATDLEELDTVLKTAAVGDGRPTLIRVPTTIGRGAPTKAGTAAAHGAPLGADDVAAAKEHDGWPYEEAFTVPSRVAEHADQTERGGRLRAQWCERFEAYRQAHPALAAELERRWRGELPEGWQTALPDLDAESTATRKASATVINALAEAVPELVGGSADLAASNNTTIKGGGDVAPGSFAGRNLHFGVREHAMGAISNGLVLHGGLRPFAATFLIFSDYMRPPMRLAAMMGQPVVYAFTHDSIGLGEDGPTHQPIEQLAALRAVPNLHVIRPADASETVGAWRCALERGDGPTAMALTRQNVPALAGTAADGVAQGAYAVRAAERPDVVLVATGSEVAIAVDAADALAQQGLTARVVSMPCWERFVARPVAEREAVLPPTVPTVSVEAAAAFGWQRWSHTHVGMDGFGASAPHTDLYPHFGITAEAVADTASALVARGASDQEGRR